MGAKSSYMNISHSALSIFLDIAESQDVNVSYGILCWPHVWMWGSSDVWDETQTDATESECFHQTFPLWRFKNAATVTKCCPPVDRIQTVTVCVCVCVCVSGCCSWFCSLTISGHTAAARYRHTHTHTHTTDEEATHTHTHTHTHTLGHSVAWQWEVIQWCCFQKYPAAPAALTHNLFSSRGSQGIAEAAGTNNGSGKDSDMWRTEDGTPGSLLVRAGCGPLHNQQNTRTTTSEPQNTRSSWKLQSLNQRQSDCDKFTTHIKETFSTWSSQLRKKSESVLKSSLSQAAHF